jgi:hypothetical protein
MLVKPLGRNRQPIRAFAGTIPSLDQRAAAGTVELTRRTAEGAGFRAPIGCAAFAGDVGNIHRVPRLSSQLPEYNNAITGTIDPAQ